MKVHIKFILNIGFCGVDIVSAKNIQKVFMLVVHLSWYWNLRHAY